MDVLHRAGQCVTDSLQIVKMLSNPVHPVEYHFVQFGLV